MRGIGVALLLFASAAGAQDKDLAKRIEAAFDRLTTEKSEPLRAAARAELESIGKPVLPVVKRFLEEELQRAKKAKEKADVLADRLVPRLDDDAVESRESAALALIDLGEAVLPALKKHEKSPSIEIRARVKAVTEAIEARRAGSTRIYVDALQLFVRLSGPAGAALVAGFFDTRDPELRAQALKSFHEVAVAADLPKLKPLLADADLKVRALAAAAVADLGLDAAAPMLIDLVKSEKDPAVWNAALSAMARWRSLWPADVAARVAELIPGAPAERRKPLIYAFFRAGRLRDAPELLLKTFRGLAPAEKAELLGGWPSRQDVGWLAVLKTLAFDPDPAVAGPASVTYGQISFLRFGGPSVLDEKWETLSPEDRICAARALGAMTENQTHYAFNLLMREPDPGLRKALLDATMRKPSFVAGPTLRDAVLSGWPDLAAAAAEIYHHNTLMDTLPAYRYLFQTTADPALRARLGLSLATEGDVRGVEHLPAFFNDAQPRLRARACEGVGATRATSLAGTVAALLKDPDLSVRLAAGQALLSLGDPKFMGALWELRTESATESLALRAVGKLGGPADVDRLVKHLDAKPSSKAYAVAALFHLSPLEPHPLLQKLAADRDPNVQSVARRALDDVQIAAALKGGALTGVDARFAYERDFVFAEGGDARMAAEKRAIPLSLKEFLAAVTQANVAVAHGIVFRKAAPPACPPEILEGLAPGHPKLADYLRLLRARPYVEAGPRLAALPPTTETTTMLAWCDPAALRRGIMEDLEKGALPGGAAGLTALAAFMPREEHALLLIKLSKSGAPEVKAAAESALSSKPTLLLARMLADGRYDDRARVLRALAKRAQPGTLPVVEASLKDADPATRALAAAALLEAKGAEAVPAGAAALKEAAGDAAWELAAKLIVHAKPEHAGLFAADAPSGPVHAVLARLGRKESVGRVLEGWPATPEGLLAAGLALAPHADATVQAKLLPFLSTGERSLGAAAALARSADPAVRSRVMEAMKSVPLYVAGGRIHPAIREALEGLIEKDEPGAVERAAMYRAYGLPGVKEEAAALLRKSGSDEAASRLLEFLNVSIDEIPIATPLVLESIRAHVKGPKTREKLKALLAAGTFLDHAALAPLFVEMGIEAEHEEALEKKAKGGNGYVPSLGAMRILAKSATGVERLKRVAAELNALKETDRRVAGGFAALLSGLPMPADDWRTRYFQGGGGAEATLLVGELRIVEGVGEMLRRQKASLSGTYDAGMAAALPLLTCEDLRPPWIEQEDYWPALAKFLSSLHAWVKRNRGRTFEEVFGDALKARGYAGGPADPKALVAALEDKDAFIAANAAWTLRRLAGRPPELSFHGEWGRWSVRRPDAAEIAAWKAWKK